IVGISSFQENFWENIKEPRKAELSRSLKISAFTRSRRRSISRSLGRLMRSLLSSSRVQILGHPSHGLTKLRMGAQVRITNQDRAVEENLKIHSEPIHVSRNGLKILLLDVLGEMGDSGPLQGNIRRKTTIFWVLKDLLKRDHILVDLAKLNEFSGYSAGDGSSKENGAVLVELFALDKPIHELPCPWATESLVMVLRVEVHEL